MKLRFDDMAKKVIITALQLVAQLVVISMGYVAASTAEVADSSSRLADVTIYNMTPDLVGVHCQSSDRDLHQQWLQGNSGRYAWDFYPRIWWGRTEWYCNFKWPAGAKWQYFLVWTEQNQECAHCVLLVKPDGFWRNVEGTSNLKFIRPWLDVFPPPH